MAYTHIYYQKSVTTRLNMSVVCHAVETCRQNSQMGACLNIASHPWNCINIRRVSKK